MVGKKLILTILCLIFFNGITYADQQIPPEIYQWVQSSERMNYYFNKEQMGYLVDSKGKIDLTKLEVPTLCTYDQVQIQDVIQKRRWRNQSTQNYNLLVGRAEYLLFDLTKHTVTVTRHEDLDYAWGILDFEENLEPVNLDDLSVSSVEGRFYRAILDYAAKHQDELIARSKGELSKEDQKRLRKD